MNQQFGEELLAYIKECEEKGIEPDLPRLCYFGHKVVHAFEDSKEATWQCMFCGHEWTGYDGFECPKCSGLKDPPRWVCSKTDCGAEWFGKNGSFCPKCGHSTT